MLGIIYGLIDGDTLELRYVGQTTKSLDERLRRHKNSHNTHLRRWLNKRPVNIIVLERDPVDLNEAEIRWIREMREQGARLMNMTDGGEGGRLGLKHTSETRVKIGVAQLGHGVTTETRAKMSAALRGRKNTPEARVKMSVAKQGCKGHKQTLETRTKIGAALRGYKHTSETCAKMSAAKLGRKGRRHTHETRANIGAALRGRSLTSEHCAKIGATLKGRVPWNKGCVEQKRLEQIVGEVKKQGEALTKTVKA